MNDQRKVIFEQRIELMSGEDVAETISDMRRETVEDLVAAHVPQRAYAEQWDMEGLQARIREIFGLDLPVKDWAAEEGIAEEELKERLIKVTDERFAAKVADFSPGVMRQIEKAVLLQSLDALWREHLVTLDHLRQVVGFRGYAQRDPLNEYKTEAFELFQALLTRLREQVTQHMMRVEIVRDAPPQPKVPAMEAHHLDASTGEDEMATLPQQPRRPAATAASGGTVASASSGDAVALAERDPKDPASWGKVGRNEACPCGSGKKFKHCHGKFV